MRHWLRFSSLVWILALILFLIPFAWFRPGEMDLGGDSSRLYFYDPSAFLQQVSRYFIAPGSTGGVEPNFYYWPYVGLMALLKSVGATPWFLISLVNGVKLAGAFLGIYLVVKKMLLQELKKGSSTIHAIALVCGLFYAFSLPIIGNWSKALTSHNQVVLNPIMFYLLLCYLTTQSWRYVGLLLLVSFIFAPSFAITSAPPFFAFYPLAMLFALVVVGMIWKKPIPWKGLVLGAVLFFGLHAFHLLPQLVSLWDPGSFAHTRVFDKASILHEGVRYFLGVLPLASVSTNILLPSIVAPMGFLSWIVPFITILGFLLHSRKQSIAMHITALFFLVTLYLLSAKIGIVGVSLYKWLFYVPGFSMFRNFIGQWPMVFTFFYAVLLGYALFSLSRVVSRKVTLIILAALSVAFLIGGWPLWGGSLADPIHSGSQGVRVSMRMDPKYEEFLTVIRGLPDDGKLLTVPLTDAFYQVLHGTDDGAYIGPSIISYVTQKRDFVGYQSLYPYSEEVMRFAKEGNSGALTSILSLLSIRYIVHNEDPRVYEDGFPGSPYTYMKTALPQTQEGYRTLIRSLPAQERYRNGPYVLYELDPSYARPQIYVADFLDTRSSTEAAALITTTKRSAFVEAGVCDVLDIQQYCIKKQEQPIELNVVRVSPVLYKLSVVAKRPDPYVLVFQNNYHNAWELQTEEESVSITGHMQVNGYANGWIVLPGDLGGKKEYTLWLTLGIQRVFGWGVALSLLSLVVLGISLKKSYTKAL